MIKDDLSNFNLLESYERQSFLTYCEYTNIVYLLTFVRSGIFELDENRRFIINLKTFCFQKDIKLDFYLRTIKQNQF